MTILGRMVLDEGAHKYSDSRKALSAWVSILAAARWVTFVDLKLSIRSADYVRPYTVFNIRGNHYRLICLVDYERQVVAARKFLTHAEYDKGNWK